jgi:hypothetical protein
MQHKKKQKTNEKSNQIVFLTVFDMLRPTQSFLSLWCPLLTITVSPCLPA